MKLSQELQQIEGDYKGGIIQITEGLSFSQYRTLRTVEYYSNSKYLNGNGSSLAGNLSSNAKDRPFYNIVNAMVDTAVVATDIDTKDIRVEADKEKDSDKSWLFNHEIQNWMKQSDFAKTLNEMGETRARYGGVLVKKQEEDGEMQIEVVDWKNAVTDQVSILDGVIIEKHWMTPIELKAKEGSWENIDEAVKLWSKKGYTRTDTRMEVWEVHGEFPDTFNSEDDDSAGSEGFTQQMHFFAKKDSKFVHLYWGTEKEMPYKYLPWKKVSGRALGRGVVEEGDEAQVWTNDAVQKEQAAMELSGKVILKTNSKKVGNNVMSDLDNGSIVVLEEGKDLNVLNLMTGAMPQFQNMKEAWFKQFERATSSYDAVRGETPPSGQPYRLQALVANAGGSHFDYRREEWGIFLKEVFTDWVFPHIEKKLNKQHILAADFSPEELAKLDEHFSKHQASEFGKEKILEGEGFTQEEYLSLQDQFGQMIGKGGKRRFLDIPKDYYKDMEAKLTIDVTGESKNKMATLESLNSMLKSMIPLSQSGVVTTEDIKMVLNRILEVSGAGISPMSLSKSNVQPRNQMMQEQPMQPMQPQEPQPIA